MYLQRFETGCGTQTGAQLGEVALSNHGSDLGNVSVKNVDVGIVVSSVGSVGIKDLSGAATLRAETATDDGQNVQKTVCAGHRNVMLQ